VVTYIISTYCSRHVSFRQKRTTYFYDNHKILQDYVIVPVRAMKAEGEVDSFFHSFFTLALDEGGWSASWRGCLMPERTTGPTEDKARLAPQLVCTYLRGAKSLDPIGNWTSDCPAHSLVTILTELPWLTNHVIMSIILQFLQHKIYECEYTTFCQTPMAQDFEMIYGVTYWNSSKTMKIVI
jgi:hypothetical protein